MHFLPLWALFLPDACSSSHDECDEEVEFTQFWSSMLAISRLSGVLLGNSQFHSSNDEFRRADYLQCLIHIGILLLVIWIH